MKTGRRESMEGSEQAWIRAGLSCKRRHFLNQTTAVLTSGIQIFLRLARASRALALAWE